MVGETIAGRYRLDEQVGSGGMSRVYRAHDTLLERNVALKILHEQYSDDQDFVDRFRREARSVAQLSHPNIVTVIDRGEEGSRQYIVFEYIDGENLKEHVVRRGRLPVRDALGLGVEIAHGLGFAHEHGIVHRDVKPQNVLLDGDGRAKVTDFGIARSLDVEKGSTQTGTVLGTSSYIAPEQASGQQVDAHTDVYSLGVVLYELLAGDVPFPGDNFVSVAMKHVHEPPPSLLEVRRDVPQRVAAAVDRALAKDPADRFDSMAELGDELEACLAELDAGEPGEGATLVIPSARSRRQPRRAISLWAVVLGLLGLAALAAVIIGFVALGSRDEPNPTPSVTGSLRLAGVGAFDPEGDGSEHGSAAGNATDRNPATFWSTEHYRAFRKSGVGLVLDAGKRIKPSALIVTTESPGFTAQIEAGSSPAGPFLRASGSHVVSGPTTFELNGSPPARYYVVWITELPAGYARVNEVRARP